MLIDIGPAVINTAVPFLYGGLLSLGVGFILIIIAAVIESGRKHDEDPWYAIGGTIFILGLVVTVISGVTSSTNRNVIDASRVVQAAESAGYTQIQEGPADDTVLGKDDEGNLVLLHITEYSDTEYLVNRIEG